MKKTLITLTLLAVSGASASAALLGQWDFENTLDPTSAGSSGTASGQFNYATSLTANTVLGDYVTATDMGKGAGLLSGSRIKLENSAAIGTIISSLTPSKSFTLSSYIYFMGVEGDNLSIFGTGNNDKAGLSLGIASTSGGYCFDYLTKAKAHQKTGLISGLTTNTWLHVAISYDSATSTATWYLNGASVATQTIAIDFEKPETGAGCAIGANGLNQTQGQANMILDKVQVYDVALSQADIVKNAGMTKPVPEPATATLSLLALAGLAARRRRK